MKLQAVRIKNLFKIFNYYIEYPTGENVLIITGPNGFGKTQVLNIVFNLFNKKFLFFQKLVFDRITICLEEKIEIEIEKHAKEDKESLTFILKKDENELDRFDYTFEIDDEVLRNINRYLPIRRINQDEWIDHRNDRILSDEDVLAEYLNQLPEKLTKDNQVMKSERFNQILDSINVHLIREQRLFRKVNHPDRNYRNEKGQTVMTETIKTYAQELKRLISLKSQESFRISQTLDSSYPDRLINEKNKVAKDAYNKRFEKLKEKQEKLTKNGLYESKQKVLGYSQDDAKALLVYLDDLEKKLEVFDDLLEKLELFTGILNERRFTFKSIHIDSENGFYFKTVNDKELELSQLSSGEQHEVVLLYELIFNTKPNIIVLIDEPEISLHVTWQKEFLNDLLRIISIQNFQVLIATHSPSIINDRWDLVYNLEKIEEPQFL